uniref:Uncharacterized protein n=1 Tax=Romanomermis culicivorax TaxID=13658 RepID=A0A915IL45_ROMCU
MYKTLCMYENALQIGWIPISVFHTEIQLLIQSCDNSETLSHGGWRMAAIKLKIISFVVHNNLGSAAKCSYNNRCKSGDARRHANKSQSKSSNA